MPAYLVELCVLLIHLLISIRSQNFIYTKIKEHYSSTDCIAVYFNNYNYSNVVSIDLNSSFSWFYDKVSLKYRESSIIKSEINLTYRTYALSGNEIQTALSFPESQNKSISLQFYFIMTSLPGIHGSFGLGHSFSNENYSIVHQYYKAGYINKLSFSIIKDHYIQSLYFGGIPSNFTEGRNQSSCEVNQNQPSWSCGLRHISIKAKEKEFISDLNSIVYFNNVEGYIYCPSYYMDELINTFFKEEFKANKCYLLNDKPNRYILCTYTATIDKGSIIFHLGDYAYTQDLAEYWICGEETCRFSMRENPNEDKFAFGTLFYQRYNMLFDYELNTVSFYSFESIEKLVNKPNALLIKSLLIVVVIGLLIGIGVVAEVKYIL